MDAAAELAKAAAAAGLTSGSALDLRAASAYDRVAASNEGSTCRKVVTPGDLELHFLCTLFHVQFVAASQIGGLAKVTVHDFLASAFRVPDADPTLEAVVQGAQDAVAEQASGESAYLDRSVAASIRDW